MIVLIESLGYKFEAMQVDFDGKLFDLVVTEPTGKSKRYFGVNKDFIIKLLPNCFCTEKNIRKIIEL